MTALVAAVAMAGLTIGAPPASAYGSSLTVSPSTGPADGYGVHVTATVDNSYEGLVVVVECTRDVVTDPTNRDRYCRSDVFYTFYTGPVPADIDFTTFVYGAFTTSSGEARDCTGPDSCVIALVPADESAYGVILYQDIAFDPPAPKSSLTVSPSTGLADGDEVHVTATVLEPFVAGVVVECTRDVVTDPDRFDDYCGDQLFIGSNPGPDPTPFTIDLTSSISRAFGNARNCAAPDSCVIAFVAVPVGSGGFTVPAYQGISFDGPFDSTTVNVAPGGTVSTEVTAGQSPSDPLGVSVQSPTGGDISIAETAVSTEPLDGFTFLGRQVQIEAPPADSVEDPLRLSFRIDASLIPAGETEQTIQIVRDGVVAPNCEMVDGQPVLTEDTDPCVSARRIDGDDVRLDVLALHASTWNFAVEAPRPK